MRVTLYIVFLSLGKGRNLGPVGLLQYNLMYPLNHVSIAFDVFMEGLYWLFKYCHNVSIFYAMLGHAENKFELKFRVTSVFA